MKKFFVSGLVCLFMTLRAMALDVTVPDDKVLGAEKLVALGEVVRLSLPKLDTTIKNLTNRAADWSVLDGDTPKQFIKDGESIILGTGITNKKFRVIVAVSYLYLVKDDKGAVTNVEVRTKLLIDTLKVGSETPIPPPPPPVPVVLPKGKFDVSQRVYNNVYTLVADVDNRVAYAQKLADSYTSISSAIAAGGVKTGKDALEAVTAQNRLALGTSGPSWDVYFSTLADVIYPMYQNRQIVTVQDFKTLFDEIALGLKAVK